MQQTSWNLQFRALSERHAALEAQLAEIYARPIPDDLEAKRIKRLKLRIKEEITRIQRSAPGEVAAARSA